VFDDGSGPGLYAGGWFDTAGGVAASGIAKWNGSSWAPLGRGTGPIVISLAVFDGPDGVGPALIAGGDFAVAPDSGDGKLARWACPFPVTQHGKTRKR
jgi:hypothetical protein